MKKRNRRKKSAFKPKRPSRKLLEAIGEAMELHEEGDSQQAQENLIHLLQRYPRNKIVLSALVEVCGEQEDWTTFAIYGEQLLLLERGEERANSLNNLIVAYTNLVFPALAWQQGKKLVSQHPNYPDIENIESLIEGFEEFLLEDSEQMFAQATAVSLSTDERLVFLSSHDRIRFYTQSGQTEKAIESAEALLETAPGFIPVLNNLSLAYFAEGNSKRAIKATQDVLDQQADNFHALANMIRYQFLIGQLDAAQQTAVSLKQITSDNADLWIKQAEAFAYIGDDEGVCHAYRRAEETKEKGGKLFPLLMHLAAAAHFRLGDEKKAWQLWQQTIKIYPGFSLAQANLEDRRVDVGERDAPWYWSFPYWFSGELGKALEQFLLKFKSHKNEQVVAEGAIALLHKYPYMPQLLPHFLDRGDRQTRDFIIRFIGVAQTPELTNILYDFCTSRIGADDLRMQALQVIQRTNPDLFPLDGLVPMWLNGKQTELFTLNFEIYEEPELPANVDEEMLEKHDEAYELLLDEAYDQAEPLLQEIIVAAPHFAAAYNHLALVYQRQGRQEEALVVSLEIQERFPNYLFGCVTQAHRYIQEGKIEEARALVQPFLQQKRLHISEFRVLAGVHVRIAVADDVPEGARSWLDMWEQVDEGNPEIAMWRMRIDGPSNGLQKLRNLLEKT